MAAIDEQIGINAETAAADQFKVNPLPRPIPVNDRFVPTDEMPTPHTTSKPTSPSARRVYTREALLKAYWQLGPMRPPLLFPCEERRRPHGTLGHHPRPSAPSPQRPPLQHNNSGLLTERQIETEDKQIVYPNPSSNTDGNDGVNRVTASWTVPPNVTIPRGVGNSTSDHPHFSYSWQKGLVGEFLDDGMNAAVIPRTLPRSVGRLDPSLKQRSQLDRPDGSDDAAAQLMQHFDLPVSCGGGNLQVRPRRLRKREPGTDEGDWEALRDPNRNSIRPLRAAKAAAPADPSKASKIIGTSPKPLRKAAAFSRSPLSAVPGHTADNKVVDGRLEPLIQPVPVGDLAFGDMISSVTASSNNPSVVLPGQIPPLTATSNAERPQLGEGASETARMDSSGLAGDSVGAESDPVVQSTPANVGQTNEIISFLKMVQEVDGGDTVLELLDRVVSSSNKLADAKVGEGVIIALKDLRDAKKNNANHLSSGGGGVQTDTGLVQARCDDVYSDSQHRQTGPLTNATIDGTSPRLPHPSGGEHTDTAHRVCVSTADVCTHPTFHCRKHEPTALGEPVVSSKLPTELMLPKSNGHKGPQPNSQPEPSRFHPTTQIPLAHHLFDCDEPKGSFAGDATDGSRRPGDLPSATQLDNDNRYEILPSLTLVRRLTANDAIWQYCDYHNKIQGPFKSTRMKLWAELSHFPDNLPMRYHQSMPWVPYRTLFPPSASSTGRRVATPPFTAFPVVYANGALAGYIPMASEAIDPSNQITNDLPLGASHSIPSDQVLAKASERLRQLVKTHQQSQMEMKGSRAQSSVRCWDGNQQKAAPNDCFALEARRASADEWPVQGITHNTSSKGGIWSNNCDSGYSLAPERPVEPVVAPHRQEDVHLLDFMRKQKDLWSPFQPSMPEKTLPVACRTMVEPALASNSEIGTILNTDQMRFLANLLLKNIPTDIDDAAMPTERRHPQCLKTNAARSSSGTDELDRLRQLIIERQKQRTPTATQDHYYHNQTDVVTMTTAATHNRLLATHTPTTRLPNTVSHTATSVSERLIGCLPSIAHSTLNEPLTARVPSERQYDTSVEANGESESPSVLDPAILTASAEGSPWEVAGKRKTPQRNNCTNGPADMWRSNAMPFASSGHDGLTPGARVAKMTADLKSLLGVGTKPAGQGIQKSPSSKVQPSPADHSKDKDESHDKPFCISDLSHDPPSLVPSAPVPSIPSSTLVPSAPVPSIPSSTLVPTKSPAGWALKKETNANRTTVPDTMISRSVPTTVVSPKPARMASYPTRPPRTDDSSSALLVTPIRWANAKSKASEDTRSMADIIKAQEEERSQSAMVSWGAGAKGRMVKPTNTYCPVYGRKVVPYLPSTGPAVQANQQQTYLQHLNSVEQVDGQCASGNGFEDASEGGVFLKNTPPAKTQGWHRTNYNMDDCQIRNDIFPALGAATQTDAGKQKTKDDGDHNKKGVEDEAGPTEQMTKPNEPSPDWSTAGAKQGRSKQRQRAHVRLDPLLLGFTTKKSANQNS